ncbi:9203_t:CDS:2 [Ambispora gerdemannii]|uniref:9203_t:CDS:1 n=1 Tax=Ambispora gerdemannii TaxID=144530 RepID=A0A9N8Z2K8_9GLOM|nr:9203_t:CDS:2 [Ambispora gerdemannii]
MPFIVIDELLEIYDGSNGENLDDDQINVYAQEWLHKNNYEPTEVFSLVFEKRHLPKWSSLLAFLYCYGIGTETDEHEMFKYYKYAAEADDMVAQNQLGWCYAHGHGVDVDWETAFNWFQSSASKGCIISEGNTFAQNQLGYFYQDGIATERSVAKAYYWYTKAISGKNTAALYNVALLYQGGLGVPVDIHLAIRFYRLAINEKVDKAYTLDLSELICLQASDVNAWYTTL